LKRGEERGGLREYNRGDKFDQSTLYASIDIPQWSPFVLLIHSNKKGSKFFKILDNMVNNKI
jgi:hypothetical protein